MKCIWNAQNKTERHRKIVNSDATKMKNFVRRVFGLWVWETTHQPNGEKENRKIIYLFLMLEVGCAYNEHIFRLNTCINLWLLLFTSDSASLLPSPAPLRPTCRSCNVVFVYWKVCARTQGCRPKGRNHQPRMSVCASDSEKTERSVWHKQSCARAFCPSAKTVYGKTSNRQQSTGSGGYAIT